MFVKGPKGDTRATLKAANEDGDAGDPRIHTMPEFGTFGSALILTARLVVVVAGEGGALGY